MQKCFVSQLFLAQPDSFFCGMEKIKAQKVEIIEESVNTNHNTVAQRDKKKIERDTKNKFFFGILMS